MTFCVAPTIAKHRMESDNKTLLTFQAEWAKLVDKGFSDYSLLTPDERVWFSVQSLIGDVDNGGLISHYYNAGANHNVETIDDLVTLGFPDIANLLSQLNKLFPGGQPSLDIGERNDVISSWADDEYENLLDELDREFFDKEKDLERKLISHIETKLRS